MPKETRSRESHPVSANSVESKQCHAVAPEARKGVAPFFLRHGDLLKLVSGAIFLLAITLGFSIWFSFQSWEKEHIHNRLDAISPALTECRQALQESLDYNLTTGNFNELRSFFKSTRARQLIDNHHKILHDVLNRNAGGPAHPGRLCLFIADTTNKIYYQSGPGPNENGPVTAPPLSMKNSEALGGDLYFLKKDNNYHLFLPLHTISDAPEAYIALSIDARFVEDIPPARKALAAYIVSSLTLFAFILLIGLLVFSLKGRQTTTPPTKRRVSIIIFSIVCSTQALLFLLGLSQFFIDAWQSDRTKTNVVFSFLADDLKESAPPAGECSSIDPIDACMDRIEKSYPQISSVSYIGLESVGNSNQAKTKSFSAVSQARVRNQPDSAIDALLAVDFIYFVDSEKSGSQGVFVGKQSTRFVLNQMLGIAMDLLTVVGITILFLIELLILLFKIMETQLQKDIRKKPIHFSFMRPTAFLFLFGIDISMSFLPLHAEHLYQPIWGLSKDTVMGLPISVEFLFVGIAIFICGFWNDRRGWHEPFLTGLFLSATGGLYSWIAPDITHFIIARALVGIGYGFMLLAAQGFVIAYTDVSNRAQGLAQFIAGLYSGSICGGATGALLADYFGYRSVFLFGAIFLYAVMGYTFLFFRHAMVKPAVQKAAAYVEPRNEPKWAPFFKNKVVLALVLFSSLPASIAVVGFLNYFSPIYLNSIGVSQATIGRVLMIYGFSLIFMGPMISRHVDASCDKKLYIFIGCVIGSLTFLIFHFVNGLPAAIIAVFLLGLSSSFVIASQGAYLLNLQVTQRLGPGKAIGFFRATSRVGQALGPLVFSALMVSPNVSEKITQFGLIYLLTAFLFLLLSFRDQFEFQRNQA